MKTATYKKLDGEEFKVEYDENAPCIICGEPVVEASMGGTVICPWCDCGHCRYCGVQLLIMKGQEHKIRSHMAWHKQFPPVKDNSLTL